MQRFTAVKNGMVTANAATRAGGVRTLYVVFPERPVAPPRVPPPAAADVPKGKKKAGASSSKGAVNPAYREALKVLEAKQAAIKSRIAELEKSGDAKEKKTELEVEYQYSLLDTHKAFQQGRGDVSTPVYAKMHEERFRSYVIPQLLEEATETSVIGDGIPNKVVPEVNLEVNFSNTRWLGPTGHATPPNWTLHSPEIVITTNDEKTRYFTLMLVDLDRPNEEQKRYEEWCHWMITDIPITQRLVIPSRTSPYIDMTKIPVSERSLNTAGYFPPPPEEVSEPVPGTTVLPYVPLHPAFSDPKHVHRYIFYVMEQKAAGLELPQALKDLNHSSKDSIVGNARGSFLPAYKFLTSRGLEMKGYGFLRSTWNIYTSKVYEAMGIHEPVYGRPGQSKTQKAFRIQSAQELLQRSPVPDVLAGLGSRDRFTSTAPGLPTIEDPNAGALTADFISYLNRGVNPPPAIRPLPTLRGKDLQKLRDAEPHPKGDAALAWQRNVTGKTPGISAVAAAALVRKREGLGAAAPFLGREEYDGGEEEVKAESGEAKTKTWVRQEQPRGGGRSRFQNV
ncbi:phosphatidylethanolamine-binding protein [Cladochytrium replicatum]|nr:phosphatidylethanolamine-binding protein [Cladochytrium replicatum]